VTLLQLLESIEGFERQRFKQAASSSDRLCRVAALQAIYPRTSSSEKGGAAMAVFAHLPRPI
jgi:hypothetical protein